VQELHIPVIIIVWERGHISHHVVHTHNEPLEHGVYGLTGEMSEVLVLSLVGHEQPSLNLSIPSVSFLQLLPNPTSQVLCLNPIEFGLTQSTKQVVDRLVVGVMHIPRSWSYEVNQMNISCVHRNIPKDLTLAAEESNHPLLPHLVVLTIKV
jgi:hypothetical protein